MKKHLYSITGASHGMGLAMAQQLMRAAKLGETRVETCLWRDGACQTPSYWSTRNRSFGMRHPAFTKGSALPVLTAPALKKLPVARYSFCCPVGRLSIDRFLVLQYEGKRQMPSRECAILNATWAQAATKLFNVSHRKRTGSTLWYLRNPFLPQGDSP